MAQAMGDKFCLKWNEFQENLSSTFSGWRNTGGAFTDITLACDNDQFVETHKIVLSAASPFFMKLLQRTKKEQHPLIYLRGIEAKNLASVLDFIYHGQANVYQEDLQNFLSLAQELQLKGLQEAGDKESAQKRETRPDKKRKSEDVVDPGSRDNGRSSNPSEVLFKMEQDQGENQEESIGVPEVDPVRYPREDNYRGHDPLLGVDPHMKVLLSGEGGLEELDMQIAALMERGDDNVWTCKVCGKKATKGGKPDMRDHIEANHVEGVCHTCDICGKTSKSVYVEDHINCKEKKKRQKKLKWNSIL